MLTVKPNHLLNKQCSEGGARGPTLPSTDSLTSPASQDRGFLVLPSAVSPLYSLLRLSVFLISYLTGLVWPLPPPSSCRDPCGRQVAGRSQSDAENGSCHHSVVAAALSLGRLPGQLPELIPSLGSLFSSGLLRCVEFVILNQTDIFSVSVYILNCLRVSNKTNFLLLFLLSSPP